MSQDQLQGSQAENILTLLVFNAKAAGIIANTLEVGLLENDIFKEIADKAVKFFEQFKEPPKEHIADLLEKELNGKDKRKADLYQRILVSLYNNRDNVNEQYALSQLTKFIRKQKLKAAVVDAAKEISSDNIDEAERILEVARNTRIETFSPGLLWGDPLQTLRIFENPIQAYRTGIGPLDDIGIGPAPGQLMIILAGANKGKTFFLMHLGKHGVLQRLKVLHLSLEMSEEKMGMRYVQSFFAISKRVPEVKYSVLNKNENGSLISLSYDSVTRPTTKDHNIKPYLKDKIKDLNNRYKFYIKRFPTGALSVAGLESYLDGMERFYNFVPDILLVDYADLMKMNVDKIRTETGAIYKDLRRIAVERNIAVVTASQANRLAEDAKVVTLKYLAEDYSKAAIADDVIAYCVTDTEYKLGLARLFLAKARDEERAQTFLITQAYRMGQFCLDAVAMNEGYWPKLSTLAKSRGIAEPEPEQEEVRKPRPRINLRAKT